MALPTTLLPQGAKREAKCPVVGGGYVEQVYVQGAETARYKAATAILLPELCDMFRVELYEVTQASAASAVVQDVDFLIALGTSPTGGAWEAIGTWQPKSNPEVQGLCTIIRGVPALWVAVWARVATSPVSPRFQVACKWAGTNYDVTYGPLVKPGP